MATNEVTRIFHLKTLLMFSFLDWFISYFQPQANAGNWLAAAFAAFVIRFIWPNLPFWSSFMGWLVSFIIACLFSPDVIAAGGFFGIIHRTEGNYAAVAFAGDIIIQTGAYVVRLSRKVGETVIEDPGAAYDSGLERFEKTTNVWVRIKAPVLDLLNTIFSKKP